MVGHIQSIANTDGPRVADRPFQTLAVRGGSGSEQGRVIGRLWDSQFVLVVAGEDEIITGQMMDTGI